MGGMAVIEEPAQRAQVIRELIDEIRRLRAETTGRD